MTLLADTLQKMEQEFNTQSPTTTDEKLWAAEIRIKELELELLKSRSQIAALKQQLEARND